MTADLRKWSTWRDRLRPKVHCPVCGHDFMVEPGEIRAINTCPVDHLGDGRDFTPDQLITEDDDYTWVI